MSSVLVLIADVEASKGLSEDRRKALQEELQAELDYLNRTDHRPISPYTITLGDEFQAVFTKADGLFADLFRILALLYPVKVRFSLGIGSIATPINEEQAIGMDGPAFHQAREGIDRLKESGFLFSIRAGQGNETPLKIVNSSLQLLSHEIQKWKKNRLSIFYLMNEGYDYKEIADQLNISQPAFYKNKEAGALDVVTALTTDITELINQQIVS